MMMGKYNLAACDFSQALPMHLKAVQSRDDDLGRVDRLLYVSIPLHRTRLGCKPHTILNVLTRAGLDSKTRDVIQLGSQSAPWKGSNECLPHFSTSTALDVCQCSLLVAFGGMLHRNVLQHGGEHP